MAAPDSIISTTATPRDPTKVWIEYLMSHGGYLTLLGIPSLFATIAHIGRIRWLYYNRTPHGYGRTNLIYWPTQFFIVLATLILISLAATLEWHHSSSDGMFPGVLLTLFACLTALPLNAAAHRFETRSSDYLLSFLTTTVSACLITLYILSESDPWPTLTFHHISYFTMAITCALLVESFPRTATTVQRLAREKENLSDYQQANLCSRLTYLYYQRIVSTGAKRPLTASDLANTCPAKLLTHVNYQKVAATWERNKEKALAKGKKPSFIWSVLAAYKSEIAVMLTYRVSGFATLYIPPMLFGQLLQFIDDYSAAVREGAEPPTMKIGFMIAGVMFIFNLVSTFLLCIAFQGNTDLGIQARAATIAMVYRKSLRLSPQAKQSCTLGEITNHMAVDAERWIDASIYLPLLVTVPFELSISIYLLYKLLGWSLIAGLAVFAILVPIQAKMAGVMNGFQDEKLKWMDNRLRLMTEILTNIKIVKLYNWEMPFRQKIDALRSKELKALKGLATVGSLLAIVFSSITLLMALVTFSVYATIGGPNMTPGKLNSEIIFVSITLFSIMNRPLGLVAHMISKTIAVDVAMKRIQNFLLMEEIDTSIVKRYSRQPKSLGSGEGEEPVLAVNIEQGTFSWEKQEGATTVTTAELDTSALGERQPLLSAARTQPRSAVSAKATLSNINLRVLDGHLTAFVGRIGQGKSSLMSAIMGEMYKLHGSVSVYGDLAYVPQQAWIINATVRDNILFGKAFDEDLYDRVIYASGLKPDFEMLSAGDQTEIGERGINLSGGQKQRVSLARAAYQDADIYILDDPLSAVDAHVDQHLWQNLLGPEGLLKDKTRLLVTHGIHHLENVDQIVVLKDGMISETGEYQDLMKARGAFYQLIKEFSVAKKKKKHHTKVQQDAEDNGGELTANASASSSIHRSGGGSDTEGEGEPSEENTIADEAMAPSKKPVPADDKDDAGELVADERMEEGKVGWRVAIIYAKAADTEERDRAGEIGRPVSYYLRGYGMLVLLYMVLNTTVNYVTEAVCGIQASKVIHENLLDRVLRLPMAFFDVTPMGRIVNRFSSDIYSIDSQMPGEWNELFTFGAIITGTLFVIAYSTPAFLLAVPPLILTYFWVQGYFIKSSGSLKRLYSVSKSPLYQHFSETLTGVSTIRVMKGLQNQFVEENEARGDLIGNRLNAYCLDNRWLQIRLESLGAFTVFIAAALAVWNAGTLDPSLVGLALSYSLSMVQFINYMVRTVSEVQNILVSVERVDEYTQKPTEAPVETGVVLPENWPSQGQIVFKNYCARYREGLDLVVKGVSFTVAPTEKVGIVGRTGAGKSSLTLALFRIIEAADSYWAKASDPNLNAAERRFMETVQQSFSAAGDGSGGSIEIDGVDISTLGLKDLRQHLSIIPQDPTLFAGTVRDNLDPFAEHTDKDLWEALERAHLKSHISALAGGLSFEVAQNGDNFSVGQRSLICLARALLRKTKVLVLDEATAAVDVETDDLIQKTIRKEFKDRTILTIAHRIKTGPTSPERVDLTPCFENTILFGLPSIIAIIAFTIRGYRLFLLSEERARFAGKEGRVHNRILYGASMACLGVACVALVVRLVLLTQGEGSPATLFGAGSLFVAWVLAAGLNHLEQGYKFRSSTHLFTFYAINILASLIHIRTLHGTRSSGEGQFISFCVFFGVAIVAFVVEAWPRRPYLAESTVTDEKHRQGQDTKDADIGEGKKKLTAYEQANLCSRLCFYYLQDIFSTGFRRPLLDEDIAEQMPRHLRTQHSFSILSQMWEPHKQKRRAKGKIPNLMLLSLRAFGGKLVPVTLISLTQSVLEYSQVLLLGVLLDYITKSTTTTGTRPPIEYGIILAVGLFLSTFLATLASGQFFQCSHVLGIELRTALIGLIYKKSLVLSPGARQRSTVGEISNHMSVDVERIGFAVIAIPMSISSVFEIVLAIYLLYDRLGPSSLTSVGVIIMIIPMQALMAKVVNKAKDRKLAAMDNRIRILTEVLSSIKTVKMYSWENAFRKRVARFRATEIKYLRHMGVAFAFMCIMFSSLPLVMSLLTFVIYSYFGGPNGTRGTISAEMIFVTVTLFARLAQPLGRISGMTSSLIALNVAYKRIQGLLLEEELDLEQIEYKENDDG
ncbi:Multidrug resistance-associated protein 1, partial [Linnemannia exigua]